VACVEVKLRAGGFQAKSSTGQNEEGEGSFAGGGEGAWAAVVLAARKRVGGQFRTGEKILYREGGREKKGHPSFDQVKW